MKKLATLLCVMFLMTSLSAKTIYVATDGSNSNDGSTWDKAVADLQTAYTKATAGDQIWIAGGTYVFTDTTPIVNMIDGVNVYGGFQKGDASVEARVRPDAANKPYEFTNATVFTSNGAVLTIRPFDRADKATKWQGAILDGLAFQDLATTNGKMLFLQTGVTVQNCVVKGCGGKNGTVLVYFEGNCLMKDCLVEDCYPTDGNLTGVQAVRLCGSKVFKDVNSISNTTFKNNRCISLHVYNYAEASGRSYIKDCTFDGNKNVCIAYKNDGSSTPVLTENCLFENNVFATAASTVGEGSVISGRSSSAVVIINSIIRNNENSAAAEADLKNAVVSLNDASMRLVNCLVNNNKSAHLNVYCGGHMINNTIANNVGSIGVATKSIGSYINNIFVGNTPTMENTIFTADSESAIEFYNNAIAEADVTLGSVDALSDVFITGVDASSFMKSTDFAGTASGDAQMEGLRIADFSLTANSPCVNAGMIAMEDYGDSEYIKTLVGYIDGTEVYEEALTAFEKDLGSNVRIESNKISLGAYQGAAPSAIEDATADDRSAVVYGIEGAAVVEVEDVVSASIYNMTGSLIKAVTLNVGINTIPVASNGLYLIKVGNAAYKVIVK